MLRTEWYWHCSIAWHRYRAADVVSLGVVDTQLCEQRKRPAVLYVLGDRPHAGFSANLTDQAHHLLVDPVVHKILDETAVNLDVIYRQALQVAERAVACAEIIERQFAAQLAQGCDLSIDVFEVPNRKTFGNFEDEGSCRHAVFVQVGTHPLGEVLRFERVSGQIDRESQFRPPLTIFRQPGDGVFHHPVVNLGH